MFKDVEWLYSKVKRIPIWGKIAIGILVIGLWLIGQLAFRNSMMEIQNSSAFIRASAIVVGNKEVQEVVGENVLVSLVIGDQKKRFFVAKISGSKGYSFIKATYIGDSVTGMSLKVKDSGITPVPEYLRGDWVALKI